MKINYKKNQNLISTKRKTSFSQQKSLFIFKKPGNKLIISRHIFIFLLKISFYKQNIGVLRLKFINKVYFMNFLQQKLKKLIKISHTQVSG